MTEPPHQLCRRLATTGYTEATILASLERLAGLDAEQARAEDAPLLNDRAREATTYDVLGGLMLNLLRRNAAMEEMRPMLRREDAPASSFTTYRGMLKDQDTALLALCQHRNDSGRDKSVPSEKAIAVK